MIQIGGRRLPQHILRELGFATVEEAALSNSPGRTLCVLHVRYLQAVRSGPAVATTPTFGP